MDYALFVYNNTYNSTAGFAPYELIYGRANEIPCEITNQRVPIYNYENYVSELRSKLRSMHQLAAEKKKRKQAIPRFKSNNENFVVETKRFGISSKGETRI